MEDGVGVLKGVYELIDPHKGCELSRVENVKGSVVGESVNRRPEELLDGPGLLGVAFRDAGDLSVASDGMVAPSSLAHVVTAGSAAGAQEAWAGSGCHLLVGCRIVGSRGRRSWWWCV